MDPSYTGCFLNLINFTTLDELKLITFVFLNSGFNVTFYAS